MLVDTFDAGVVDTRDNAQTGNVVAGVTVAPVLCHLADVSVGVVDVEVVLHCVAAVENADNTARSTSTIFLFPNPFVNKDFTLRPTVVAALTATRSRLSESNRNIPGLITRWTAWIFSDNKSNPVVDEHCIIADRGVVFACHVVERGVVVSERQHGIINNWHGVVVTLGIDVLNGVAISPIILSSPTKRIVVVAVFTERAPSGGRVLLGGMSSSVSSMVSLPERSVVVIVLLPSTTA
jgi:hypothetical protein